MGLSSPLFLALTMAVSLTLSHVVSAEQSGPGQGALVAREEAGTAGDDAADGLETHLEGDEDPIHSAMGALDEAVLTGDVRYPTLQTLDAGTFSDYSNSTGLATGAVIRYNRLVTLEVTALKAGAANAARNSLAMARVMDGIHAFSARGEYAKVMFQVVIPKGKYYLEDSLRLYSNTWLSMNGVTFYKGNLEDRSMARGGNVSDEVSGYNGESNIVLEGGVWDVRMSQYSPASQSHFGTLRFGHAENILLANVTCNGTVNGHQLEFCGVYGVTVVGCTMKGYLDTAYHGSNDGKEAIQLDIVHSSNISPAYCAYDDTVTGNVVIYQNVCSHCCRGVGSHSAIYGTTYSNIVIAGNRFYKLSGAACHLPAYQKTAVVDNVMTKVGAGVELFAMCRSPDGHYYEPVSGGVPPYSQVRNLASQSVISGNRIQVNRAASPGRSVGILVSGDVHRDTEAYCKEQYGGKTFTITGVRVEGNTVTAARDAGIWLKYAGECTVSGNTIRPAFWGMTGADCGIALSNCDSNVISANGISRRKWYNFFLAFDALKGAALTWNGRMEWAC